MGTRHRHSKLIYVLLLLTLIISGCTDPSAATTEPTGGDGTPVAQAPDPTEAAPTDEPASETPPPTEMPTPTATSQPSPTATEAPSPTPTATVEPTATPGCTLNSAYAADVSIPDNTVMLPGTAFTKTWRLSNTGNCPWPEEIEFRHVAGEAMAEVTSVAIDAIEPEDTVEVSVDMTAPDAAGRYQSDWRICEQEGECFGAQVYVLISAQEPTPTPDPNAPTPEPTAVPPPPAPAPSGSSAGFGYGVQADMITDGNHDNILNHVQGMGFGWIKQQVEWFRYNPAPGQYDWGALDRIVDSASARGIRVLFSVVKAPGWARPAGDTDEGPPADPNTYGDFVREMAARYKGRVQAYEIWNEQNLYYEWGGRGGKINAARYVELLKVAYANIKAVDPGAIVISGALTPTGVNDGDIAIDDRQYLEQMYQAGMKNYCDAVGAHPSGYNNPPDADWRSYNDPNEPNCKGHPSWFFRGTMESYRNIMVKYGDGGKKIWPTEFGWATVENLGVAPVAGYEYAAQNTEGEQAAYLVRAYQMGRNWGWVGPMFLWNLNFGPVCGPGDEKAAFGVVRPDWGARPAYAALRDMGK